MARLSSHARSVRLPQPGNGSGSAPAAGQPVAPAAGAGPEADASVREQVAEALALIRPAIQSDGGDVELVRVLADGQVQVRLSGACVGCPSSQMTLQEGIERTLRSQVEAVRGVVQVA